MIIYHFYDSSKSTHPTNYLRKHKNVCNEKTTQVASYFIGSDLIFNNSILYNHYLTVSQPDIAYIQKDQHK